MRMPLENSQLLNQLSILWRQALESKIQANIWAKLEKALSLARSQVKCYPPKGMELAALGDCEPNDVKAVVLGQDPYHSIGQAHGLAFSVMQGVNLPPSLRNVLKELRDDVGPDSSALNRLGGKGVLACWSEQGVLLLNDVLTVSEGAPGSQATFGWQDITGAVLDVLIESESPKVFILWGNQARRHKERISHPNHLVLEAPHPSPLSAYRGFFGSKPFSQANAWLEEKGLKPIFW